VIEAVVFDVGETLVDETRAWSAWADHLGVPRLTFMAALGAFIARGAHHREPFALFRPGIDMDAEIRAFRATRDATPFEPEDLYPDAVEAIRELARCGYRLGAAANQPIEAVAALRALDLPFELIGMSDAWGLSKPDPRFFERIARELDLPPERIAYVGDRLDNDVIPARAAGMTAVFVRRGPWAWIRVGREAPAEASIVIERLTDLPEALESLRG
jgi:HAD superfamily hydrolase (TIGR01509 family)